MRISTMLKRLIPLFIGLALGMQTTGAIAQKPLSGITIRVLASANPDTTAFRDVVAKEFAEQTGATVKFDMFPYGDMYNKEVLSFVGGQYDMYWVDQPWLRKFQKSGYLEPLDQYIKKYGADMGRFYPNLVKIATIEGHIYAIPATAKPVNFGYRKDVFDAKGIKVPKTWAELLENAKVLNDPAKKQYGFVMRTERGNPICWTWIPILRAFGGEIFDKDMRPIFNSKEAIASVEYMKALYQYSMPGALSTDDVVNALANGAGLQTTMIATVWPGLDDPKASKVVNLIEYADMPTGPSGKRSGMVGFAPYAISASSRPAVKDAAFQLLNFFMREDIQRKLMVNSAWYPAMPALYDLPNVHRSKKLAGKALTYSEAPPLIPEAEEWFIITGTALQDVLLNNKPAKEAMDEAVEKTRQMLQKVGYYK